MKMTGGSWRMLAMLALLAFLSFLSFDPVDAQASPCGSTGCDLHATCYSSYARGSFCACDGYYTGDGYTCKYSTWRVVLYMIGSVIGFVLIFYLCLSCLGYRRRQEQPVGGYPMLPLRNPSYSYPPPPGQGQPTANPAMYAYPSQTGYPIQTGYPPQTGYPVTANPPQVAPNQASSKVPGPSGTV